MSHQRAEKKYPVDKYAKESNSIALFQLKIGLKKKIHFFWKGKQNI